MSKYRVRWNQNNGKWQGHYEPDTWAMSFLRDCPMCGGHWVGSLSATMCGSCREKHRAELQQIRQKAANTVAKAKKQGKLAQLNGDVPCVDCGKPAEFYDHRDYDKPLDVVPVCRRCNIHRGTAPGVQHLTLRSIVAHRKASAA